MAKPFRFRYVNEITGSFVLAAAGLLVVAVVLMAQTQRWFTRYERLTISLPEEGSLGLRPGADVQVLGTVVGQVDHIGVNPDTGQMTATLTVQQDFIRYIRRAPVAHINKTLGIAGDAYVEIQQGPPGGAELVKTGQGDYPPIPVSQGRAAARALEDTIEQIRAETVPALHEARLAFTEYRELAADLRDPDSDLQQALRHANRIASSVEKGEGLAGKVLSDPKMADEVERTLPKVNRSLDDVQAMLADVRKTTATLPDMAASASDEMKRLPALVDRTQATLEQIRAVMADVRKTTATLPETARAINQTAEALPGLVVQMQETMRQIQRLVEGMQRSVIFGGGVAPDDTGTRIRPERVGGGR